MRTALKWTFLTETLLKATQLVSFYVWITFLSPAELGIASEALLVASFAQILWQHPANKYLIRQGTRASEFLAKAVAYNLFVSALPAAIVIVIALFPTHKTAEYPLLRDAIIVLSANIFYGLSSTIISYQQAIQDFRLYAAARSASIALNFVTTIVLILLGLQHQALLYGYLAGSLAQISIVAWPTISGKSNLLRIILNPSATSRDNSYWRFGAGVFFSQVLVWLIHWYDSAIVATTMSNADLGEYRLSQQITISIYAFFYSAILPVYYSYRSNSAGTSSKSALRFDIRVNATMNTVASSCLIIVILLLSNVVQLSEWPRLFSYMILAIIAYSLFTLIMFFGEVYRVHARPGLEILSYGILVVIMMAIYPASSEHGGATLLLSKGAISLFGLIFVSEWIFRSHFSISMIGAIAPALPTIGIYMVIVLSVSGRYILPEIVYYLSLAAASLFSLLILRHDMRRRRSKQDGH